MRIAIVALAILIASPAYAGFEGGNGLYSKCPAGGADNSSEIAGLGYVIGVYDAMTSQSAKPAPFCRPAEATAVQMRDVVCQWLANNPAHRHYAAESIVSTALVQSWPCPKQ